ncbi:FixH family protein [Brevibacillus sp. SAFN-007a]|uniref:FixH family protein n=1 Tax=Brevibacillus sp. SAFN-007a TaxID=3436862 RepID=UPI003F7F317A
MMRNSVALALSCLLFPLFTLMGCASKDHAGHARPAAQQQANTPMLEELSIPLQVALDPSPAKHVQENTLRITATAEHAAKLEPASVFVSLTMPNMDHGAIVFEAVKEKEGAYVAQIVPTMPGDWLATITFELDGQTMSAAYPFRVEP